jgi:hypothetical protein
MGDRANYAIVHRGRVKVFYAHWGGPTVPRELAAGPLACERFIRTQRSERTNRLLEFSFMEGGIALDKDTRRALVFGGPGAVNYSPDVQARLLERLRPAWSGWTLEWARRYAYDFVAFLGLDGARIETDYYSDYPVSWDQVATVDRYRGGLVARRIDDRWDLRVTGVGIGQAIGHGQRLLAEFAALSPAADLAADELQDMGALLFDEPARRLVIVAPLFASLNAPHHVARRARAEFPGWTVELDLDLDPPATRLAAHGLPVPVPVVERPASTTAEIDELLDRVLAYRPEAEIAALTAGTHAMIDDLVAAAGEHGETVVIEHNMPRAPSPRRTRTPPWHKTPRGRRSRRMLRR